MMASGDNKTTASAQRGKVPAVSEAHAPAQPSHRIDSRVVCLHSPRSAAAEAYRQFRTAIATGKDPPPKVLMITSALPGEGKSVTVANLAVSVCRDLKVRVLVVDCDLRKGSMSTLLGLGEGTAKPGLTEVLSGAVRREDVTVPIPEVDGLSLLPAGGEPVSPAELLNAPQVDELLRELRTEYDLVLLDAPAVLPVMDSAVLGPKADAVALVVEAGRTRRARVDRALEMLDRCKIIGFLLNKSSIREKEYRR